MKKVLGVVMAAVVAVALTGCSGFDDRPETRAAATASQAGNVGNEDASAKGVIYGIYKTGDQTWFTNEGGAAKKVVGRRGDEFIYMDAKMNPEEYLKAIDNMVINQAKGIVTCIPGQAMSQVVMDRCKEAEIPMAVCDGASWNDADDKLASQVGINAHVIGQISGDWLATYAKDNNLVEDERYDLLLLTMNTVSSYIPRAEGEYDNFTANCPDFPAKRIFGADHDGTTGKGNVVATLVITAHPEIKKWLVTGANEEGTIGAVRAPESTGLDGGACVVSLGAYIAKGEWNGKGVEGACTKVTTYSSSDSVGKGSAEVLYEAIGGKEFLLGTAVDAIVATPKSYREAMEKAAG